ncbi:hypothetical protein EYF80_006198 [Liparis tanakae]|uniref:Uncharacterized protein n=1 Tax=Liparis tanakae TaxID=230148 RepID=A0A4Z2J073_9TELE|nr:hypothetical protein EYF80_006198 [Liparis tanakae]
MTVLRSELSRFQPRKPANKQTNASRRILIYRSQQELLTRLFFCQAGEQRGLGVMSRGEPAVCLRLALPERPDSDDSRGSAGPEIREMEQKLQSAQEQGGRRSNARTSCLDIVVPPKIYSRLCTANECVLEKSKSSELRY